MKKLIFTLILSLLLCGCNASDGTPSEESLADPAFTAAVAEMYEEMAAYEPTIVIYQVKEGKISGDLGEEIAKTAFEAIGVDFETVAKLSDAGEIYKTRENCYRANETSVAFKVSRADQMPELMEHLYHRADYGSMRLLEYGVYPNEMTKDELRVYVTASVAAELHVLGEVRVTLLNDNATPEEGLEVVCEILAHFDIDAQTVMDGAENAAVESTGNRRFVKTDCYAMEYEVGEDGSCRVLSLTVYVLEEKLVEAILTAWELPEVKIAWMNELHVIE
ncbi:MAG: hypothetical protein IJX82_01345 [Clostridia bacterium]|nr:hypothetical protein [Clostridia bacterium]